MNARYVLIGSLLIHSLYAEPTLSAATLDGGDNKNIRKTNYIQVALFHPLQLLPAEDNILGLTWNIFYGENHNTKGVIVGLVNMTRHTMGGIQLGGINSTHNGYGLQFGLINQSSTHHGLQIGIINKTTHLSGVQLELLNIVESHDFFKYLPILNAHF